MSTRQGAVDRVIGRVESQKSDSTGDRYGGAIRVFAKWCAESDAHLDDPFAASAVDIEEYLSHLDQDRDYAYRTVKVHISALNSFYQEAEKLAKGGRDVPDPRSEWHGEPLQWDNPADEAKIPKMFTGTKRSMALEGKDYEDKLKPDEVEDLIANVPAPVSRNAALLNVMYHGMLRRNEAALLKVSDINRDERTITIRSEISKNGNRRKVPYTRSLNNDLVPWLDVDREAYSISDDSEYVFLSNERDRLSPNYVGDTIYEAAENAGLQEVLFTTAVGQDIHRVTSHTLRRSGATRRWENECDIYTIKEWLGHESVDTTKDYINAETSELIEKNRNYW